MLYKFRSLGTERIIHTYFEDKTHQEMSRVYLVSQFLVQSGDDCIIKLYMEEPGWNPNSIFHLCQDKHGGTYSGKHLTVKHQLHTSLTYVVIFHLHLHIVYISRS
jgi:hypothetical protein